MAKTMRLVTNFWGPRTAGDIRAALATVPDHARVTMQTSEIDRQEVIEITAEWPAEEPPSPPSDQKTATLIAAIPDDPGTLSARDILAIESIAPRHTKSMTTIQRNPDMSSVIITAIWPVGYYNTLPHASISDGGQ